MNDKPTSTDSVQLSHESQLTIDDLVRVARKNVQVDITTLGGDLRNKLDRAVELVGQAVDQRRTVYGVNTGFGGMSGVQIAVGDTQDLQRNLIWFLKAGAGDPLPREDVRAAMLLRARSFMWGASGVRWQLVARIQRRGDAMSGRRGGTRRTSRERPGI